MENFRATSFLPRISLVCLLVTSGGVLTSCASLFSESEETADTTAAQGAKTDQSENPKNLQETSKGMSPGSQHSSADPAGALPIQAPAPENFVSQREVASLQLKVTALERHMANLKKEMKIIRRGLKTGLLDALPDTQNTSDEKIESDAFNQARIDLGFEDAPEQTLNEKASGLELENETGSANKTPRAPQENADQEPFKLLEKASALVEKREYPAALVHLTRLKEGYPQFNDEGISEVLLAESWLALGAADKALSPLERFLGVYPTSPFLARAKLAQANAFYRLGERQRSLALLLEVISIAPKSPSADIARSRLSEIKEVK